MAKANFKRKNSHLNNVPSNELDILIEKINSSDLGWKADVCKL